jgi:hypothetical protein
MVSTKDKLASLEAAIRRLEKHQQDQTRLVSEAIRRQFSKRNVSEDELIRDVQDILGQTDSGAENSHSHTSTPSENEESEANPSLTPEPGPSSVNKGKGREQSARDTTTGTSENETSL